MSSSTTALRTSTSATDRACTPHQYLMRRRVERTQRLPLISDDPLSQIAAECGFVSQSHLSNVFLKMVGERPGRWRRVRRAGIRDPASRAIRTL
jgi:AraC-like DNA-binding protein